ncbi:SDR family mycofactocin-dependent oxidoreductase [Actinocorallia herbida]|uniref:SDR family mycofactocin-dependent oxidoreductase n=1 Tax=Actinocorallia herbida TaxID=58109 RepID=A0A3N1D331_9ACTN|nr:mycofactocin-coupled SDR family oxidoreductase [Actinocorallia herbida]ROO87944.1 SDR family mycofactocin-dependent oxidoreductase [Actinocorallia herbida]
METGLAGKVAFITGAARGQGRAHAVRLAGEGVSIIGVDICADLASMDYPNASPADLEETRKLVEAAGGGMVARVADVRDQAELKAAFDAGLAEFGRIDIVIANAGIVKYGEEDPVAEWRDIIDTNLTGVWNACRVAIPALIEGGRGGSIVITSSSAGLKGVGSPLAASQAYTAAKRGLVGLMQVFANDLAPHGIRVNTVHPTGVRTGMIENDAFREVAAALGSNLSAMQNALPVAVLEPEDIAEAVAWLVSDRAAYVTGITLPVDAGFTVR